ncbi:hypothetical protein B9Z55_023428 [Caenorhabditis nigoni]|uniref:Uncharacterized protein n=1 Tax=Caenorhabditis nigoni TaxID=1611254 RepID=A0A2G5SPM6_9PELO|nr:hypothetical protein B9Z55_023428 [Caenorhabditis nigoni]
MEKKPSNVFFYLLCRRIGYYSQYVYDYSQYVYMISSSSNFCGILGFHFVFQLSSVCPVPPTFQFREQQKFMEPRKGVEYHEFGDEMPY